MAHFTTETREKIADLKNIGTSNKEIASQLGMTCAQIDNFCYNNKDFIRARAEMQAVAGEQPAEDLQGVEPEVVIVDELYPEQSEDVSEPDTAEVIIPPVNLTDEPEPDEMLLKISGTQWNQLMAREGQLMKQVDELTAQNRELLTKLSQAEDDKSDLYNTLCGVKDELVNAQADLRGADSAGKDLSDRLKEKDRIINVMTGQIAELEAKLKAATVDSSVVKKYTELECELADMKELVLFFVMSEWKERAR